MLFLGENQCGTCCAIICQDFLDTRRGYKCKKVCGEAAYVGDDYRSGIAEGISTIAVDPGCVVEAFKGKDFTGEKTIITKTTDLTSAGIPPPWDNQFNSIRVRDQCCAIVCQDFLDSRRGYKCKKVCGDTPYVGDDYRAGIAGGISSMVIDPGCVVDGFKGKDFTGEKITIQKTVDLTPEGGAYPWDNQFNSIRVRLA